MPEPTSDKHYEETFEFPLWKLIKERAQEKDISYSAAYREVLPEYEKTIRYKDTEWTDAQIRIRNKELAELQEHARKKKAVGG